MAVRIINRIFQQSKFLGLHKGEYRNIKTNFLSIPIANYKTNFIDLPINIYIIKCFNKFQVHHKHLVYLITFLANLVSKVLKCLKKLDVNIL